jgi:site-specific DNA-methyltransferase (adenine-specific)
LLNTYQNKKEPDILEVISDLSNDEVFTPPAVARQMLDLLPPEVWSNPALRWIDPFTKTGVFLREITKRLLAGLKEAIPDDKERLEHILRNMVFGVAITELTSLMSRRSLYCSKWADSDKSVVKFSSKQGNLIYSRVEHEFFRGRCSECFAGESQHGGGLETENYAYPLLHQEGRRFIEKEIGLKFDIVVGNPPYQMDSDGGTRTIPLYNLFVQQAMALGPKHISMVIPSRWMAGGLGLSDFRDTMLSDQRFRRLVDFPNAKEVFPGVEIKGGVCYFHWDEDYRGECLSSFVRDGIESEPIERNLRQFDVFVRDHRSLSILEKVQRAGLPSITEILSVDKEFGWTSNFRAFSNKKTSNGIPIFFNEKGKRQQGWIERAAITKSSHLVDKWKVMVPKAGSDGGQKLPDSVLGSPFVAGSPSVCTQTYLFFFVDSEMQAESIESYVKTKFFRYLVSLRKISQDATKSTYLWVPTLDWSANWSDAELYEKFQLSQDEISIIEAHVREMS